LYTQRIVKRKSSALCPPSAGEKEYAQSYRNERGRRAEISRIHVLYAT